MSVTTKFGAQTGTRGGSAAQIVSAVVTNTSQTGSCLSSAFPLYDNVPLSQKYSYVFERDSGNTILRTHKILSSGTFAYNAAAFGTYIISRITTSLSGVASNNLLFMGCGNKIKTTHFFVHDFGVKMLNAWVTKSFAWTGRLANGNSKASRQMWLTADQTAVSAPATLTTTFMRDIGGASQSATPRDDAIGTRTLPGELVIKIDFVTKSVASGGDFLDYKPITGM